MARARNIDVCSVRCGGEKLFRRFLTHYVADATAHQHGWDTQGACRGQQAFGITLARVALGTKEVRVQCQW